MASRHRNLPDLYTNLGCPPRRRLHLRRMAYHEHVVILQARAMRSFENVVDDLRQRNIRIWIMSTYRSCTDQARVCSGICGNPHGCPGRCAPPGGSYHQLGLAIDSGVVNGASEQTLRNIYEKHGWHYFSPMNGSDPQHCSFHVRG